jgi:hypothetical protein
MENLIYIYIYIYSADENKSAITVEPLFKNYKDKNMKSRVSYI